MSHSFPMTFHGTNKTASSLNSPAFSLKNSGIDTGLIYSTDDTRKVCLTATHMGLLSQPTFLPSLVDIGARSQRRCFHAFMMG